LAPEPEFFPVSNRAWLPLFAGALAALAPNLALAQQTVLDHGGDMWAESEPGGGACFRLRLPVTQAGRATPEHQMPASV